MKIKKSNLFLWLAILVTLVIIAGVIIFIIKIRFAPRPAIIIIAFDTLRADHLSCYGYPRKTTPNIDRFSKEAVLFKNAVAPAPDTATSFMSLFTALAPTVHNVFNFDEVVYSRLSKDITTLPMLLKQKGYFTAGFTNALNLSEKLGFGRGFDIYKEKRDYCLLEARITEIAQAITEARKQGKPLFLFIHTFINHAPYVYIPREFSGSFVENRIQGLPFYRNDVISDKPFMTNEGFFERFDRSNPDHLKYLIGLYDSATFYNDRVFGAVREMLEQKSLYDDAIVIILADHGEEFLEHGNYEHNRLFVECLHVPLIIKFPHGRYASVKVPEYVRTMDLMPTLLDILNENQSSITQGVSFMPLLDKKNNYSPLILSELNRYIAIRVIKDGFAYSNKHEAIGKEFLYDVEKDPAEKNNLAGVMPDLIERMRSVAHLASEENKRVLKQVGSSSELVVHGNSGIKEELKALGYAQ